MRVPQICAGIALGAAISSVAEARASEHARAQLRYEGPESCPNESELRQEVLARLGYDPFDNEAPRVVTTVIRRTDGRFVATVTVREENGVVRTREPLVSTATRCDELAASVVLAMSIAIDPMSLTRPPAAPPPAAPTSEPAAPPGTHDATTSLGRAATPIPPERRPVDGWLGIGAESSVGVLPSPSFGVEATPRCQGSCPVRLPREG
jgi:hypothetical protein